MTVKIVSMQRVNNHGSFLQGYALMKILGAEGANVEFLDIRKGIDNSGFATSRKKEYDADKKNKYKYIFNRVFIRYCGKKQRRIFETQRQQYLGVMPQRSDDAKCDLAVIGSDEVFNCTIPSAWGLSDQLFGNIPGAKRVITYAASCGRTTESALPKDAKELITNSMQKLDKISVRDQNTVEFVTRLLGTSAVEQHLDPVLIYDFKQEIITCPFAKPFLLLYSYTYRFANPVEIAAIKRYAKEKKLEIVCAGVFQFWSKHNIPVSSFELLGYFKKADCVITDTFHGSIMSMIMHRPFITIIRDSNRNKLVDLLSRLKMESRICDDIERITEVMETQIDYSEFEVIRESAKRNTYEYLKEALTKQ